MLRFLVTREGSHTFQSYLKMANESAPPLEVLCYEDLEPDLLHEPGTYVFSDLERLTPDLRGTAGSFRDRLDDDPKSRCLNDPRRWVDRAALHDVLWNEGVNDFASYPASPSVRPTRYPVFLRHRWNHDGPIGRLLRNRLAFRVAVLRRTVDPRTDMKDIVVTEFCETADASGIYRKFGAFRVGGAIIPRHVFFSRNWMVKGANLLDPHLLAEESSYLQENPHEELLRGLFDRANVDWGRIDYSFRGDRIQVWEINTNPMIVPEGDWGPRSGAQRYFLDLLHEQLGRLVLE